MCTNFSSNKKTNIIKILFCVFLFSSTSSQAANETVLKFGVTTTDRKTEVINKFTPITQVLEKRLTEKLGEKIAIELVTFATYEVAIRSLAGGAVDLARFGPVSYIEAKKINKDTSILAMEAKKGKKTFNGVICIRNDSDITSIGELRGKSFAFGNKLSTIGRYLAQLYLAENKIFARDLDRYEYLGKHDVVAAQVAAKKFDAGALKEGTFKKLVKKGLPLKALATFPNVTKPWLGSAKLDSKTREAISNTLLELKDEAALKVLGATGFLNGTDEDYEKIREAIEKNSVFFQVPS